MGRFYSDTLEEGVRLIYFQADPALFPQGVKLGEQAGGGGGHPAPPPPMCGLRL